MTHAHPTRKVLFVARYRDPTQHKKLALMARDSHWQLTQIYPSVWRDELFQISQVSSQVDGVSRIAMPMIGNPADAHRALYTSLSFGIRSLRPDIIHAEEEPDSLAALQIVMARRLFAPRAKLILNTWQNLTRPMRAEVRWVYQTSLRAADAIFCANAEAVTLLHAAGYSGLTPELPPNGVDTNVFKPRPFTLAHRADSWTSFTIGYVGRLIEPKGLVGLLQAVALVLGRQRPTQPRIKLLLIGSGPFENLLREKIAELRLESCVELLAAMPPEQLAGKVSMLDVLVLPSRTTPLWKEQFGRVLTEAMACKVPVIGSDSGAIPEVIGEGGLVFAEGDSAALADAIEKLVESPVLCKQLAERGYDRVMRLYTQRYIADQTLLFYRRLLE